MTQRWRNYFLQQGVFGSEWLAHAVNHWGFHEVLYGTIFRNFPRNARLLDVGAGPGYSGFYLASSGYRFTGVDNDEKMVNLANDLARRLNVAAEFKVADAFDLDEFYGQFDLVYSCGVLEHFDREVTVKLLQEQSRCANCVIIQIPTAWTRYTGPITDERIYRMNELKSIVREAGLKVKLAFGYGDVTATRSQVWTRRVIPRAMYRYFQNLGFAYGIAVLGERTS